MPNADDRLRNIRNKPGFGHVKITDEHEKIRYFEVVWITLIGMVQRHEGKCLLEQTTPLCRNSFSPHV